MATMILKPTTREQVKEARRMLWGARRELRTYPAVYRDGYEARRLEVERCRLVYECREAAWRAGR